MTKPVSENAVFLRLKRAVAREGVSLKASSPASAGLTELGRYYTVDDKTGFVDSKHVDLEAWARDIGVLGLDEQMVPDA